jgi:hypothetical protein
MTQVKRGQAIEMVTWPPSRIVHVCRYNDAVRGIDRGHGNVGEDPVVVAACGASAALEDIRETDAPVDCMTCLVRASERTIQEIIATTLRLPKEFLYGESEDDGADDR